MVGTNQAVDRPPVRVGLVLAGAVARGAYEAGALSVLLPELEARNERPTVLVGTSSGALNAAFLAGHADEPARNATKGLLELWRDIERGSVYRVRPPNLLGFINRGQNGVLDTSPLEKTITEALGDRDRIAYNLDHGHFDALAVVATATATSRSTVFVEARNDVQLPPRDDRKGIDYVRVPDGIWPKHLMASAAVPLLFAPVDLGDGEPRWFVDGGVRLNTPIKPAIELGAERVVIVATNPACHLTSATPSGNERPDWDDAFLQFMQAAIADPLIEDVYRLARINTLVLADGAVPGADGDGGDEGSANDREGVWIEDEERWIRPIPYLFVGPTERGVFGSRAAEVVGGCGVSEIKLIGHVLGSQGSQDKELLSYVLFDPLFASKAIELGQEDAAKELRAVAEHGTNWRIRPIPCGSPAT
jgi:NTE family protein